METAQPESSPEGNFGSPASSGSDPVAIIEAVNRLLGGRGEGGRSQGGAGYGSPMAQPQQQNVGTGAQPPTPAAPQPGMNAQPPIAQPQAGAPQAATAQIQQMLNQQPREPDRQQIDPMHYLEQYGAAKDRITKELAKSADFSDIAQALGRAQASGSDFGQALNAMKAQKIKEQMATYEMERDYAKTALKAHNAQLKSGLPSQIQVAEWYERQSPEVRERAERAWRSQKTVDLGDEVAKVVGGEVVPMAKKKLPPDKQLPYIGEAEKTKDQAKEDVKKAADQPQARLRTQTAIAALERLKSDASELSAHPGLSGVTGTVYGRTPPFASRPPSIRQDSVNAQSLVDTLKNKVFTTTLQALRDASKTGGAVGNVSDREGDRLENALVALDQAQDTATYQKRLAGVVKIANQAMDRLNRAYEETYGGEQRRAPAVGSWTVEEIK